MNILPKLYSSTYPPVDSDFKNQVTSVGALPIRTQMLVSIVNRDQILADRQYYAFTASQTSLTMKVNGVNKGTIDTLNVFMIENGTTIYGYSITPEYLDLWTDPTYRDTSEGIMYGKRGLNINPFTNNVYDIEYAEASSQSTISIALLHGINDNGVRLLKQSYTDGRNFCSIGIQFNQGTVLDFTWNPKFILRSKIISTGSLDSEVAQLQDTVESIHQDIASIQAEIDKLIPDLTKLVNAETNKFYVSR